MGLELGGLYLNIHLVEYVICSLKNRQPGPAGYIMVLWDQDKQPCYRETVNNNIFTA